MHVLRKPSLGTVFGVCALFVALGGPSLAAPIAQEARELITGDDISRSLGVAELSRKARRTLRGEQGPRGPEGAEGAVGPAGPAGSDAQFSGAAAGGVLSGSYPNPGFAQDMATEVELQSLSSLLSGGRTINSSGNPVSWSKLKDVPAPIADGADAVDGGNANLFDGLDSPQLLRSDQSGALRAAWRSAAN